MTIDMDDLQVQNEVMAQSVDRHLGQVHLFYLDTKSEVTEIFFDSRKLTW